MGAPRSYRLTASVAVLVGVLAFGTAAQAQNKCDADKLKCVAKKKACLLKVEGAALKKGRPVDGAKRQKCFDKFNGGLEPSKGCIVKLENKQNPAKPETLCTVTGDTASLDAAVDAFGDDILTDLVLDYPAVESANRCHAALAKCVTTKCTCILKGRAKAIKKGGPVDATRLQRCFDRFVDPVLGKGCVDKVYAKQDPARPETLCDVPDDGASLEGKVDDFIDDIVGAIAATPSPAVTPTPSAPPTPAVTPCCPPGFIAGELLVSFQPGTTQERVEEIAGEIGASVIELVLGLPSGSTYLMGVPVGQELVFISLFEAFPEVRAAETNGILCIPELPPCDCCPAGFTCPTLPPCAP